MLKTDWRMEAAQCEDSMWISQGHRPTELYTSALTQHYAGNVSLHLDHLNIPCRKPEWLADWYAEHLDLTVKDRMVISSGLILVFVQGESLSTETPLLGFRCDSRSELERLAESLGVSVIDDGDFCSLESADPEGNRFEVYWEGS